MKNKITVITLLLLFTTFELNAQSYDKAKMDSFIKKIEKYEKGMGSISIFNNGNEVYQNSFGFVDIEKNIRATKDTKYRIGSVSKTFTATIIMQLIDENKLSLEIKLAEFYPEIPNANEITIEQLLRHRSGLYNITDSEDFQNWMEKPHTRSELLQKFIDNGIVSKPNEKAEYSNTNYVLLSFIAEKIDQKGFSEILENRIINSCQLKNTYYGGNINSAKNEALSYIRLHSWKLSAKTDMSIAVGAGAIVSNSTDLNIFYNHLFNGKLVSDNSLNEMKKIVDGYGIGLFQIPYNNKRGFGHTGGIDGFESIVNYLPEDSVLIAHTSNGVVLPVKELINAALNIYFGKEYTLPEFNPAIELKSEELDQYIGIYSGPDFPLKIIISKENNGLIVNITGQPEFPLIPYDLHKFEFKQANIKIEFIPTKNKMIFRQGSNEAELTKE